MYQKLLGTHLSQILLDMGGPAKSFMENPIPKNETETLINCKVHHYMGNISKIQMFGKLKIIKTAHI